MKETIWTNRYSQERATYRVDVASETGGHEWRLPEFMVWLNAAVSGIPAEYQPAAIVELEGGFADDPCELSVYYFRPETDAEYTKRMTELANALAEKERMREIDERAIYNSLKQKYG